MCKICGCHKRQLEKKVVHIEGMSCTQCKKTLEKAVLGLPGVMAGEVNIKAKSVTIEYDSATTKWNDIENAIINSGFSIA